MHYPDIHLALPQWVKDLVANNEGRYHGVEDRMRFAIRLSLINIERGTGGPFGAAIFDSVTGYLLAAGVNIVVPSGCSVAHGEMMAMMIGQKILQNYDMGGKGRPHYQLVTSTEPCAMCLGAVPWSGIRSLVCGARDEDARAIGFDEGPKIPTWVKELENRGIVVIRDICRDEAVAVLQQYSLRGGMIYNSRLGTPLEK
jgi:tRNA(Arg) A34 adenosine deaminase TadA